MRTGPTFFLRNWVFVFVGIYLSLVLLVGCNNQNPKTEQSSGSDKKLKEEYELRERCGKYCEDYFRKTYGNGMMSSEYGYENWSFENHYNKKMNKCFILTNSLVVTKSDKSVNQTKELYDVHENKSYGNIITFNGKVLSCVVLDKQCNSLGEWKSLIKPYMEE